MPLIVIKTSMRALYNAIIETSIRTSNNLQG
jgi:hypothetical protein